MTEDENKNLGWPQDLLGIAQHRHQQTPQEILRIEADDLGTKTNGLLQGRVDVGAQGQYIVLDFFIVAPSLDDYEYRLLKARHKLLPQYPVEVILNSKDKRKATSPETLVVTLSDIFRAPSTLSVIGQLLDLIKNSGQTSSPQ